MMGLLLDKLGVSNTKQFYITLVLDIIFIIIFAYILWFVREDYLLQIENVEMLKANCQNITLYSSVFTPNISFPSTTP